LFVPHFTNSNTSSTPTSSVPTIPHLKSLYSGTRDFHPENVEYPMVLHINSQDQQGNLMTSGNSGPDVNKSEVSCTGTVTVRGSITLQCRDNDGTSFVFHGNIYSDGHIEGTETFSDGSTNTDTLR
jgi:hypothetical protein